MGTTIYPPATPAVLTPVSQLTEDYLLTDAILVNAAASTPLCIFANSQGQSELLAIDSSGNLNHVYRDPTSDSGWNIRAAVASCSATAAVAGNDPQGLLHGFYIGAGDEVFHISFDSESWTTPTDLSFAADNLSITTQPTASGAMNALVPFGVTTGGDVFILSQSSSSWSVMTYSDNINNLTGITCQLQTAQPGDPWVMFAVMGGAACSNTFTDLTQPGLDWQQFQVVSNSSPDTLTEVVVAPTAEMWGSNLLFLLDGQQNLWSANWIGGYAAFTQITSSPYTGLSVTSQSADNTMAQIYAIDTSNSLWVIRQSGFDNSVPIPGTTWYDPVPLGDSLMLTFTPPGANDQAEVFALDPTGALWSLWQDPVTTAWTTIQVQQPAAESAHISAYRTTLTLVDANGTAMPNTSVSFNAGAATTVWVEGVAYSVSPTQSLSTQTNAVGQLSVVSPAFGLGSPSMTFSAPVLSTPVIVTPALNIQSYLAGNAQLNDLPTFSGTALTDATGADGQPLAPNLTSDGASATASGIQQLFNLPAAKKLNGSTADLSSADAAGFGMDFTDPHNPTFHFMTATEIAAYRARASGGLAGGVFDDIGKFAGDTWHGIENFTLQVKNFTVDTANSLFHVTLSFATQLSPLIDIAINDIEDVVNCVHTVFAAIGAELQRVIEWLRALFSWGDIINTQQVLQHYLSNAVPFLQNLIANNAQPLVSGFFSGLETTILDKINSFQQTVGDSTNLSSMPQFGQPPSGSLGGGAGTAPSSLWSGPQHTWVFSKARQYAGSATGLDPTAASAMATPFQDFANAVASALPDFQQTVTDLQNFFKGVITQPSDMKQLAVTDLLGAIAKAVAGALTLADGIIQSLLALVDAALGALQSFLTGNLQIPLLTSLWQTLTEAENVSQPLTVAGLLSLIAAVPLTIAYKLANDNNAPFSSDQVSQILATSPSASAPAAVAGGGPSAALRPGLAGDVDPAVKTAFQFMAAGIQGIWAVFDTCLDAIDAEGALDKILSAIDIGWLMMEQMIGWPTPSGVPFDIPMTPASQRWNFGLWCCYWAPPIIDAALIFTPDPAAPLTLTNTMLRYADPVGKTISAGLGVLTLGVAVVASILGGLDKSLDAGEIAANILGPIPYIGQPLRIDGFVELTDGLTLAIQLLNDFFTGMGCSVAMFSS